MDSTISPVDDASRQSLVLPEIALVAYSRVLRKRRWVILGTLVFAVAAAMVWTLRQTKIYQGVATLDIETSAPQVLGSKVEEVIDRSNPWYTKDYYETQYKIITSRAVAQRVVDKLGLAEDPKFLGVEKIHDPQQRQKAMQAADPVAALQARTKVAPIRDSHLAYVEVEDADPERAALYANTLAESYIEQVADQRFGATQGAADWLQKQIGPLKSSLEGSELALYDYKRDHNILSMSLEDQLNTTSQKLKTLADEITRVQTKKIELAAQVKQIQLLQDQGRAAGGFNADSFGPVVQSALIQGLKQSYFTQKQKVAELSTRYEAKHPSLIQAESELTATKEQLQREIDQIVEATAAEYRAASDSEAALQKLFDETRQEAFEINKKEVDYKKLERDEKNSQEVYDLVLRRLKETDLSALLKTSNLHLLDPAIVPRVPVKPDVKLILQVALVLGLLAGLGLAFVVEKLDSTFKGQEDVERILGLPFLGIVPSIADEVLPKGPPERSSQARDLFIHTHPKSSVAECCRSIRTNLLFMSPDHPLKRILVTSSGPQEGKTTTAVSLGIAMAQSGNRVLIIDTDMRRPRLHRAFGVSNEVGISTAVVGEAKIEDCIKSTEIPNLFVLPCGPLPPNPAEMLHADRFREVAATLDGKFDRLIFDSPPLVAVADSSVLSTHVDGVVLVLKAGKTSFDIARRAVGALEGVKAPLAGAILNDLDVTSREYGYYYYYYHRGYYGEEKSGKAAG